MKISWAFLFFVVVGFVIHSCFHAEGWRPLFGVGEGRCGCIGMVRWRRFGAFSGRSFVIASFFAFFLIFLFFFGLCSPQECQTSTLTNTARPAAFSKNGLDFLTYVRCTIARLWPYHQRMQPAMVNYLPAYRSMQNKIVQFCGSNTPFLHLCFFTSHLAQQPSPSFPANPFLSNSPAPSLASGTKGVSAPLLSYTLKVLGFFFASPGPSERNW